MENETALRRMVGGVNTVEVEVRLFKASPGTFCLTFEEPGWRGMEFDIWLGREGLRTVSDLLLEGLEEETA